MDVKVHSIHFDADGKLIDFVDKKVGKLDQYIGNIIAAEVYLRLDKSKDMENKIGEVKLFMPGKDLFAKKKCKTFEEAIDLSVEALRKQIKKYKSKLKPV